MTDWTEYNKKLVNE